MRLFRILINPLDFRSPRISSLSSFLLDMEGVDSPLPGTDLCNKLDSIRHRLLVVSCSEFPFINQIVQFRKAKLFCMSLPYWRVELALCLCIF